VNGIWHIISTVTDGSSITTIQFYVGSTNVDRALNDVKDAIAKIRSDLPRTIDEPIVSRLDVEGLPIVTYAASAPSMSVEDALPGCDGGCAGGYCAGTACIYPSCSSRLAAAPGSPSASYLVDPDGPGGAAPFPAFCEMVLDAGGWTLVLKVDGNRPTFLYGSPLWSNADTLQPNAPDLDATEAKLAGFATMRFDSLRVGMVQRGVTRWLVLGMRGTSLMGLMTSGYHATNVGRTAWERLPARGSLQSNCNREGINVQTQLASVRIGIVANNQNDCQSCGSWIAFGGMADLTGESACGNFAVSSADNGSRQDALFGYVMVR